MDLGQYNNFIQAFQKAVDDIRADIANGFARLEGKLAQPTGLSQDLKNRAGGAIQPGPGEWPTTNAKAEDLPQTPTTAATDPTPEAPLRVGDESRRVRSG